MTNNYTTALRRVREQLPASDRKYTRAQIREVITIAEARYPEAHNVDWRCAFLEGVLLAYSGAIVFGGVATASRGWNDALFAGVALGEAMYDDEHEIMYDDEGYDYYEEDQ
jgi:hypothetical protein